eukprot:1312458-Rhodomonas_salina.1
MGADPQAGGTGDLLHHQQQSCCKDNSTDFIGCYDCNNDYNNRDEDADDGRSRDGVEEVQTTWASSSLKFNTACHMIMHII